MMIEVLIRPRFESGVDGEHLQRIVSTVLEMEAAFTGASLSVVVTDDTEIQSLNCQFRGIDAPTDVLSFGEGPTEHPFVTPPEVPAYLGDVVISFPRAEAQAAERGHSTEEELGLLVVHGVLHLLGYDHRTRGEEVQMWARQDAILRAIEEARNGDSSSVRTSVPRSDGSLPDGVHPSTDLCSPATLAASFGHALAGFGYVVRTQRNMRIHLSIAAAVVALGLYARLEWTQWAVLGLTMGFVLVAEMVNTVAEAVMDAAAPYYHPLVRIAKDVAAGVVLVTAVISVSVGLLVMGPLLWSRMAAWLGW